MSTMDFSEEVEVLFQRKEYAKALEMIFTPENQPTVQAFGMDLITRICECGIAFCPELDSLRACQDMLMHVVRSIRPKEALISLLEQAEMFVHHDSTKFSSLLAPLQHVMLNLPKRREHSFSWVLSILNSHMKSRHKFPSKHKRRFIQGKDALLLEADEEIKDMIQTYRQYCNFYAPFVHQFWLERKAALASSDENAMGSITRQQEILRDHLVQLLGDPLLYFDLHWNEPTPPEAQSEKTESPPAKDNGTSPRTIKTDARLISERLMEFLSLVDESPEYYLGWSAKKIFLEKSDLKNKPIYCGDDESDDADSDECIVEFSSVVNYYYLIFVERLNMSLIPSQLSPSHLFISTTKLMLSILRNDKAGPNSFLKCMHLSLSLLERIDSSVPGLQLDSELLQTADLMDFVEYVAYHTVYCETVQVRKEGLQVLRKLMWAFDAKGRYDFILFVFNRVQHDGIKGYIVTQLKDCVRAAVDSMDQEMMNMFTGKTLLKMLRLTCKLKDGVTTDLMDNKEQIMTALNLVLYLAIRDKVNNSAGFSDAVGEIEEKLLKPLYRALELSRAHYQLKLKELQEDPKKVIDEQVKEKKKLNETCSIDFKVNQDEPVSAEEIIVCAEEQKSSLTTALTTFDIMNGTLARVNEVCDVFKKSIKL